MENVKLVASDMDHTLLNDQGALPPNFAETVRQLKKLGVTFVAASGRPLYTLEEMFKDLKNEMSFISDNGAATSHEGELIDKSLIAPEEYHQMVRFVKEKTDGIAIICGLDSGYVAKEYQEHEAWLRKSFTKLTFVDSLEEVQAEANKFTVFFPNHDSKQNYDQIFKPTFDKQYAVTVGDTIWIDLMNLGVNKGNALLNLGKQLNITPDEMMAFGDTYNDIEMLKAVKYSYLMANADVHMQEYANYTTASNNELGVSKVLEELIRAKQDHS